uniref:Xanthine dehydrogenase n=1 Tax=Gracilinema caldarium TaxID=215591 RepID=A0A7C3EBF5_9SPIR
MMNSAEHDRDFYADFYKDRPESLLNLTGKTSYVDDLPLPEGTLFAVPVGTPTARGRNLRIDAEEARAMDPSVVVLTARDIPGENQLGYVLPDEPLMAAGEWSYQGEVAALVLAKDRSTARRAARLVRVLGEDLPPVLTAREAFARGDIIMQPLHLEAGDVDRAFAEALLVVEGSCENDGQEHLYLETQSAIAIPEDGGRIYCISSTQGPTGCQKAIAKVLGIPMAQVEVEARRLGGAFGGKEDQAAPWASLAALGAWYTKRPVKLVLNRADDMIMTGKRHPYSSDFKLALARDGRILGFDVTYYQNSGACIDLSLAILWRTMFHVSGAYDIPALRARGYMCRTNLVPFTAFRGFGAPQAFFVIEAALHKASVVSGIPLIDLQRKNLLTEGVTTYYGMKLQDVRAERTWDQLDERVNLHKLQVDIEAFNRTHRLVKRGFHVMPVCFGISFTKIMMNQGGALVHVYADGSVSVATGAVEMGQGVIRKILVAAARTFGISPQRIRIEKTKTTTVANTVPTAASTGADINAMAALLACKEIKARLLGFAASLPELRQVLGQDSLSADRLEIRDEQLYGDNKPTGISWTALLAKALEARVDLSAHGYYASPGLHFDQTAGKGHPFVYHVYGTAVVQAEVDILRGQSRIIQIDIVHDGGIPIDERIDRGQIEGALAQGLGWALLEDLRFSDTGQLLSNTLSTYKVPDSHFMDFPLHIEFLQDALNPLAVLGSKAVGEPPLMYGIGGYFAVLDALNLKEPIYDLPLTNDKALLLLSRSRNRKGD